MRKKFHVVKNDMVEVITGEHKGKRGRILKVLTKKDKVIVEGVNYVWKHVKPSRQYPRGGRIQIEAPIHVSNVLPICQNRECKSYDKPVRTKVGYREDGTKTRICVKCGGEIPKNPF